MATIEIRRAHQLSTDDAKSRAEELARTLETKLGLAWRWDGDVIRFDAPSGIAKGTKGELRIRANEVCVLIDLPLLLRAMKGMVEGKVNEKLDQIL